MPWAIPLIFFNSAVKPPTWKEPISYCLKFKQRRFTADKAYDADERVVIPLQQRGIQVVIPPKKNRKKPRDYDAVLYQARHLKGEFLCQTKAISSHCYSLRQTWAELFGRDLSSCLKYLVGLGCQPNLDPHLVHFVNLLIDDTP